MKYLFIITLLSFSASVMAQQTQEGIIISGTGMATASISGKISFLKARHPNLTAQQITDVISIYSSAVVNRAFSNQKGDLIDLGYDPSNSKKSVSKQQKEEDLNKQTLIIDGQRVVSPIITGAVVLIRQKHPELRPIEIIETIRILQ